MSSLIIIIAAVVVLSAVFTYYYIPKNQRRLIIEGYKRMQGAIDRHVDSGIRDLQVVLNMQLEEVNGPRRISLQPMYCLGLDWQFLRYCRRIANGKIFAKRSLEREESSVAGLALAIKMKLAEQDTWLENFQIACHFTLHDKGMPVEGGDFIDYLFKRFFMRKLMGQISMEGIEILRNLDMQPSEEWDELERSQGSIMTPSIGLLSFMRATHRSLFS